MTIRETFENREKQFLSSFAALSSRSKGRASKEPESEIRTCFQRDRDRIIHCKSFRRLKHKTQVFFNPEGDHYRDRLTHTLEVSQISRTIAKALFLNEELTEAIALGHDLGHTPFGHAGEKVLDEITQEKLGKEHRFLHNEQSIRVVTEIEKNGRGLNLSFEVLDGIKNHSGEFVPETLEGKIVKLSDKIAYINHDIDDALRAGIFSENELPSEEIAVLGKNHGERINTIVLDIVKRSFDKNDIMLSPDINKSLFSLRDFLFKNLYLISPVMLEERKTGKILRELFEYYIENFDIFIKEYNLKNNINFSTLDLPDCLDFTTKIILIRDYISNMTDRFALSKFAEIFIPEKWEIIR